MSTPQTQKASCTGVVPRPFLFDLRQIYQNGGENFLSKYLPFVARIRRIPGCLSKYPTRRGSKGERRTKKNEQQSRRKRFLVRSVSGVEYLYGGNFFRFLYFRQFVLLCEGLKNRFLNFSS